jgi:hypothetical protein
MAVNSTFGLKTNSLVYVNAPPFYDGAYKVISFNDTRIILDTPFLGTATGYANSDTAKPGYAIQLQLLNLVNNTWTEFKIVSRSPDPRGLCRIDVSKQLQQFIKRETGSDYTTKNKRDLGAGGKFGIRYREVYTGQSNLEWSVFIPQNNVFYYLNAAFQNQHRFGSLAAEHTLYAKVSAPFAQAEFLNPDVKLPYWDGYPFDLSFIMTDNIRYRLIQARQEMVNSIGSIQTSITQLNEWEREGVNRMILDPMLSNNPYVSVQLFSENNSNSSQYVDPGYVAAGYFQVVNSNTEQENNPQ